MEPASRIIDLLGGPAKVASIVGVHYTRVYSWRMPRDKGGTGGVIPHWHVEPLIRHAKANGIKLKATDFAVHIDEK